MTAATDNYINTDNWADNLLVKDDKGRLFYWKTKDKKPVVSPKIDAQGSDLLSQRSAGNSINDDFQPVQYWQGKAQDPAPFAFHPDDQKVIEELSKTTPIDDSKKYSVEKIADRLLEKQSILLDGLNKRIFVDIIYNFLRGRRDAVFTRTALSNKISTRSGSLFPETIDLVLSVIKGIKNKIDAESGLVVKIDELSSLSDINTGTKKKAGTPKEDKRPVIDLDLETKDDQEPMAEIKAALQDMKVDFDNNQKQLDKAPVKKLTINRPEDDKKAIVVKLPDSQLADKKAVVAPKVEVKEPPRPIAQDKANNAIASDFLPKVSRPSVAGETKKKVVDVIPKAVLETNVTPTKPAHVLTGPLQELQTLDLINWRRLGRDAKERARKILEKINLLEHDSFTKKAQGISNWRQSPVYQMYLDLGAESMVSNKDVDTLIRERQGQGQDALSSEEFIAISDLNKDLRF